MLFVWLCLACCFGLLVWLVWLLLCLLFGLVMRLCLVVFALIVWFWFGLYGLLCLVWFGWSCILFAFCVVSTASDRGPQAIVRSKHAIYIATLPCWEAPRAQPSGGGRGLADPLPVAPPCCTGLAEPLAVEPRWFPRGRPRARVDPRPAGRGCFSSKRVRRAAGLFATAADVLERLRRAAATKPAGHFFVVRGASSSLSLSFCSSSAASVSLSSTFALPARNSSDRFSS